MTGIPRHLMPQIPKESLPKFIRYIHDNGVSVSKKTLPINKLLPVQKHVNREKVDSFKQDFKEKGNKWPPLLITSQGFIIDGHHRWLAAKELGQKRIECIICDCPLLKFLKLSHGFDGSYTRTVREVTTYGRWAILNEHNATELENLKVRLQAGDEDDIEWNGYGYQNKFDSVPLGGYVPSTV